MQLKTKLVVTSALIALIVFSAFYAVLQSQPNNNSAVDRDVLFQVAAFNTFSMGQYTGVMSYSELAEHGDFGIGTFYGLDGEMLALDGIFYQIPSNGAPRQADTNQKAPYATVTYFEADKNIDRGRLKIH